MAEIRHRFIGAIPISNDGTTVMAVGVDFPHPMTVQEWLRFHAVLEAMKPALVPPHEAGFTESADSEVDRG